MQAFELETDIDERHQLHITLPATIPAGKARVIVLYGDPRPPKQKDKLNIADRLNELRTLKNGWLDGKGMAPPSDGFDWLTSVFESNYPDTLPLPYLYPTAEGGIQAEWTLGGYEISLEIALDRRHGEWNALNMRTEEATERSLNFDRPEDWQWLATQIKTLVEAA